MSNLFLTLSPDMIGEICPHMTISQLGEYMNLSPEIYNKCLPVLQSKKQEKALLEANNIRLILKQSILNLIEENQAELNANGWILNFTNWETYGVTLWNKPVTKLGYTEIPGYPIVVINNRYNEFVDILNAQPMNPSQPL